MPAVGVVHLAVHVDEEVDDGCHRDDRIGKFEEPRNLGSLALGDPTPGIFFLFGFLVVILIMSSAALRRRWVD